MNPLAKMLAAVVIAGAIQAQTAPGFKFYKTQEEYCYHNPDMPTCKDGKPLTLEPGQLKMLTNPMQAWCDKNPKEPVCRQNVDPQAVPAPVSRSRNSVAPAPRTPAAVSYPRSVTPALPTTFPPAPRARRGASSDIRLGDLDWRLLQPQADILVGMNMAGLLESETARAVMKNWMGKMGATSEEQERVLVSLTDVSEAVISARQNTFLAAMVGRLESFPERMRMGELEGMRVSPDTVIIGTHDALFWALHRLKFPATDSDGLNEAHMLAKTYQFWAWGRPAGLAAFGAAAAGNGTVKNIRFGANLRDGFRMDMMLETTDPDSAARVLESTRKGAPREMQFAVEGNAAHLVLAYDRETTLRRFGGFMSDSIGKRFAPLVSAARNIAAQKPQAAARPAPGKIVIDGLDDGPRQVSLGTKQ